MNRCLRLTAVNCLVSSIVLVASLAVSANAADLPYIGVQLIGQDIGGGVGSSLGSSTVAGVVPQNNFNVAAGESGGPLNGLVNASGHATSVSLSWTANDAWVTGTTTSGPNGSGDPQLLSGEDKTGSGTATYTLSNVPAGHYDLIVYTESDNGSSASSTLLTGTTTGPGTLYNTDQTGGTWNGSPVYVNGGTTSPTNLQVGNYIEFTNVSPAGGVLEFTHTALNGGTASYSGFQLTQYTPEPGSFVLLGIAGIGLVAIARRHRRRA